MLISLAVVPVSKDVWISNVTDEDIVAFGPERTSGFGSHLIGLKNAEVTESGLLTFERRDAILIRRGRTPEAILFREFLRGQGGVVVTQAVISPDDDIYWVTVGAGRQDNFEIGMRNGVWGVPEEHWKRLETIHPGDKLIFYGRDVGFALCEAKSRPYHDRSPMWPDGDYPYRIRITPPLRRNEAADFKSVFRHLLDVTGHPYRNAQAAGRAIGGSGGIFRKLQPRETTDLIKGLGW